MNIIILFGNSKNNTISNNDFIGLVLSAILAIMAVLLKKLFLKRKK